MLPACLSPRLVLGVIHAKLHHFLHHLCRRLLFRRGAGPYRSLDCRLVVAGWPVEHSPLGFGRGRFGWRGRRVLGLFRPLHALIQVGGGEVCGEGEGFTGLVANHLYARLGLSEGHFDAHQGGVLATSGKKRTDTGLLHQRDERLAKVEPFR